MLISLFICLFINSPPPHSSMTTCLTTNTSQRITTSLHTRALPLLRVAHPWATTLIPRANTTQHLPTPMSIRHLSTPPPTSRTTTPLLPLNLTLSPSQPPTPQRPLLRGPGSASRSRQRSQSPTLRQGGKLNRHTLRLLLASTCHDPRPRLKLLPRAGTLHIPAHRFRRCTLRGGIRGAAQGLEEELTSFLCLRERWKIIRVGREPHRVQVIRRAR